MWPRVWSRHFVKLSSCFTSGCCDTVWSTRLIGKSTDIVRPWFNILCSYLFEEFVLGRWLMSSILCQDRQGENAGHLGVSWRVSICVLWFITHALYIVSCYLWVLIKVTSFVYTCRLINYWFSFVLVSVKWKGLFVVDDMSIHSVCAVSHIAGSTDVQQHKIILIVHCEYLTDVGCSCALLSQFSQSF